MILVQLRAAVYKSFLQKSYRPASFLIEMLLPIIFILGAVALWSLSTDTPNPTKTFFPESASDYVIDDLYGNLSSFVCINLTADADYNAHPAAAILNKCDTADTSLTFAAVPKKDPSGVANAVEFDDIAIINATAKNAVLKTLTYLRKFAVETSQTQYIPNLDQVLMLQYVSTRMMPQSIKESSFGNFLGQLGSSGALYFTPPSTETTTVIDYFNKSSTLFKHFYGKTFNSQAEAENFAVQDANAENFLGLVVVNKFTAAELSFTLRFNRTSIPFTNEIRKKFDANGLGENSLRIFIYSGFLTVQQMMYEAYASEVHGLDISNSSSSASHAAAIAPMPYPSYVNNDFLNLAGAIAPLLIVLGYLYPVSQLARAIVEEKELRVREAMMIMGLSTANFYASWIIIYMVMHVIISLVIAGICKGTMLGKADFGIVLFLFLFFGWTTVMLSLLLSSFFSKARAAALISPVAFFVLSIPAFALSEDAPSSTLAALGILSPTAFALGLRLTFDYENVNGIKSGDFLSSTDDVNMATTFALLIIDIFLYLLLALYFDAVLPSEWGTKQPYLLCLDKPIKKFLCCCCGKSAEQQEKEDDEDEFASPKNHNGIRDGRLKGGFFQDTTEARIAFDKEHPPAVQLQGLRKEFLMADGTTYRAVKDLTLNMREGEIFGLAGVNGAGKSTAMNMLTGMIEIDKGDALIFGKSVKNELHEIRQFTGYCPQHNILWPELTCMEHLRFYAALKGIVGEEAEKACQQIVSDVDLWSKRHSGAGTLSGGQKRKLSVAIAFVGNPKFVLLDECTAGVDVGARRKLWDLIRVMAKDRVILMTSHFLEEVELLCTDITIMNRGQLHCLGTSAFLKQNLGVGYTLNIALRPDSNESNTDRHGLAKLVREHIDSAFVQDSAPGELIIKLPTNDTSNFPELLRALENESAAMGASGFGVDATTLEEVFVRIAKSNESSASKKENEKKQQDDSEMTAVPIEEKEQNKDAEENASALFLPEERARVEVSFFAQMSVLLMKRLNYARRDTRTLVMQILVPIIALLVSMLLASLSFPDQPSLLLAPSTWGGTESAAAECFDSATFRAGSPNFFDYKLPSSTMTTPMDNGYANSTNGLQTYLLETSKGHSEERITAYSCNSSALKNPIPVLFTNESFPHASALAVADYYSVYIRALLADSSVTVNAFIHPLPFTLRDEALIDSFSALLIGIFVMVPFAIIPSVFVSFIVKERENNSKHLQLVMGLQFIPYWLTNLIFDFASFFITNLLAILVFLIFDRTEYIGNATNFGAIFTAFTLYSLSGTAFAYLLSFAFDSHTAAQNIVMLFNFVFGFLLVLVVFILSFLESTEEAGKVLKWVFRIIPSFALGDAIVSIAVADSSRSFDPSVGNSFALDISGYDLIFLGLTFPIFMGLTLWLDHPNSNARYYFRAIANFFSCCCSSSQGEEDQSPEEKHADEHRPTRRGDNDQHQQGQNPISPESAAAHANKNHEDDHEESVKSNPTEEVRVKCSNSPTSEDRVVFSNRNGNQTEQQQQQRQVQQKQQNQNVDPNAEVVAITGNVIDMHRSSSFEAKEDPDVAIEAERALKMKGDDRNAKDNDVVIVQNVRKVWKGAEGDVVAVKKISFGVRKGEIFSLLGTNGAGKSSLFSILCGQTAPTKGQAFVGGYNVETETQSVRRIIGYCPQFDALTDLLTVEEHFKLYCGLRGVDPSKIDQVTEKLIALADLEEHRRKTAESLSGGNRRKLSFALALIGGPETVFLDEVSAGIDAEARHKLWALIERVSKECSIILVTHHFEEVTALANRVGIMVDGKMFAIGSLQHLRSKYGSGFEVQLRMKSLADVDECYDDLQAKFPALTWSEIRGQKMTAALPQETKLSAVFEYLRDNQERLNIENYTVQQSSLEQVFLRISTEAMERRGDA